MLVIWILTRYEMKWVVNIKGLLSACSKRESEIFKKCVKDQNTCMKTAGKAILHYVQSSAIHLQK